MISGKTVILGVTSFVLIFVAIRACETAAKRSPLKFETVPNVAGDLERIEARLLSAKAAEREWYELAERHMTATTIVCEGLEWHARGGHPR